MILEQIDLTNFRCFERLKVPLDRYLNVFVAGNGAGKTTILDAVALLLAPILTRLPLEKAANVPSLATYEIRGTGEDQIAPFLHLAAVARISNSERICWDRTKFRDASPTTKEQMPADRSEIKELSNYVNRIIDAHNTQSQTYKLPVFAFYSTNRAVNVPHNRLQKRAVPRSFQRLAGLEDALGAKTDFRRAVGWFDFLEQRELREQRDKLISGPLLSLDAVRNAIAKMLPGVRNPRIDATSGRFAVDTKDPHGEDIRLYLDQLSDGYQVMLGVVMDFALRLALANPPDNPGGDPLSAEAILIIDEVDLHLHPSWQQRVIPDLRRTFPNTQLILTTHSPQVATTVPSESLRILSNAQLHSAPAGTEGAEAQRLLEDVFLVNPRPDTPISNDLNEYLRLVDDRLWDSPRALALRGKLDAWSKGNEPRLVDADLQIENMKWEAGK